MKTSLTPEQAFQKIKHYCAYQERCHSEVREKLYGMGLRKAEVETLISRLIEDDYLNETRFAAQFAGGHFRLKKWGRIKIAYELRLKKISPYAIKMALKEIDEPGYRLTLEKMASARWTSLKNEPPLSRLSKTSAYLVRKGYENDLVYEVVAQINTRAKE